MSSEKSLENSSLTVLKTSAPDNVLSEFVLPFKSKTLRYSPLSRPKYHKIKMEAGC